MLDILDPTAEGAKLLTTMVIEGYGNQADYLVDRLDVPTLRQPPNWRYVSWLT
jgi:hypothetical protein